jgi:Zinc dependent phospholipase C
VAELCERTRLNGIVDLTEEMKDALLINSKFCDVGAVSPDYPYLKLFNKEAEGWANVMHYWNTANFIRTGVLRFSEMFADFTAPDAQRCLAWLFGYG